MRPSDISRHKLSFGLGSRSPANPVEDAVDCIDYIVKVTGIDHVGIGSDFDGIRMVPRGLEDVSKMPNLTQALMKRGYSEADIQKIMGSNFLCDPRSSGELKHPKLESQNTRSLSLR
jgi:microsomal dipeptidase-like Zn-dependent dipeptidase